jgi:hypothetical protein
LGGAEFFDDFDLPSMMVGSEKRLNYMCYRVKLGTPFSKHGSVIGCTPCVRRRDVFFFFK